MVEALRRNFRVETRPIVEQRVGRGGPRRGPRALPGCPPRAGRAEGTARGRRLAGPRHTEGPPTRSVAGPEPCGPPAAARRTGGAASESAIGRPWRACTPPRQSRPRPIALTPVGVRSCARRRPGAGSGAPRAGRSCGGLRVLQDPSRHGQDTSRRRGPASRRPASRARHGQHADRRRGSDRVDRGAGHGAGEAPGTDLVEAFGRARAHDRWGLGRTDGPDELPGPEAGSDCCRVWTVVAQTRSRCNASLHRGREGCERQGRCAFADASVQPERTGRRRCEEVEPGGTPASTPGAAARSAFKEEAGP